LYNFADVLVYLCRMKTKEERLLTILELVSNSALSNQEDLLNLLCGKGFNVTQATLSRDMKQLKIIKSPDASGNYIYTVSDQNIYSNQAAYSNNNKGANLSAAGFLSLEFSDKLAVIKTRPGYAMGIASDIDQSISHLIIGTIAGDDTILLVPHEKVSRQEIKDALAKELTIKI
jgi:Arginine repressor